MKCDLVLNFSKILRFLQLFTNSQLGLLFLQTKIFNQDTFKRDGNF
jgi:hypothetical protein